MQNGLFAEDLGKKAKSLPAKKAKTEYIPNSSALQVASLVKKGCRVIGLTRGQFSLIDLIHSILKNTGKANVICVTWSAGIKDANTVRWMLDTDLINSFMLITDHSYSTRQAKYAVQLKDLFGEQNIRTSEIHAKFCLIWNDLYNVCIRTSMNLNANRTCESFEIDECKEIFSFYKLFVDEIFGEMPEGFTPSSEVANRALDRAFNNLSNQFAWQSND